MRKPLLVLGSLLPLLLFAACDGTPRHTVVIDGRDLPGGTEYTVEVDGGVEQVDSTLAGVRVSDGDEVGQGTAEGRVGGGADGFLVEGEITGIELEDPTAARVLVDGEPHYTEEHTLVIEGEGEGSAYTVEVVGEIEPARDSLAGRPVTVDPEDGVEDGTATGTAGADADGYRIRGGIASIDLHDPDAATVYLDGREYHTVVIDSDDVEGSTDYTLEAAGRIEQADGRVAGFDVSDGDEVSGGTARGRVGGGTDGFRVFGEITGIELEDASAARVLVDGEPHHTEEHTVVIEGSNGGSAYTVEVVGEIEPAEDSLAGRAVTVDPEDTVEGSTATGTAGADADGYRIRGGIASIDLHDPGAATVYLDGREYHTVVIEGTGGGTDYTIEAAGRIEQVDGRVAGFDVSDGDEVSGGTARGRVGGGTDGFRVFGEILSIELAEPDGARVHVDGAERTTLP